MLNQLLCIFRKIVSFSAPLVVAVAIAVAVSPGQVLAEGGNGGELALQPGAVGKVTLLLGKAELESAERGTLPVAVGTQVRVDDRITTFGNGHVHIRFADQALVSVRPYSRLDIVRYDYDPANPAQSSVKFNLREGVTRSISGDAARSARERFRLNTPIAAIGVRGTDFVVSATETSVRALVYEGTIVMAPYSSECTADAFGPCVFNAVELSHNALQLLEIDETSPNPRLLPAPHERDPTGMRDEVQLAIRNAEAGDDGGGDQSTSNGVLLEGVTSNRVTATAASLEGNKGKTVKVPDFTPAVPLPANTLESRQLVWGRWANGQGALEKITGAYRDLRPGREVSVGNSDYVLLRPDLGSRPVNDGLGVVSFGLDSAQAFYQSGSGVVAMQVNGGNLDIDFTAQEFATSLDLNHALTGAVTFSAVGSLFEGGFFNSRNADQRIAGAVSLDGREAGYFFEKQLQEGGIHGLTLWSGQ